MDYPEHLGLPGFHVWLSAAAFTKPIAPLHFDLQYRSISWPRGADLTRHISFTLSVRLPSAGGGLNIWDVSHEQFRHALAKGWVESVADLKRFDDERLTLQGHGVWVRRPVASVLVTERADIRGVARTCAKRPTGSV
ncbi:hypothetical protein ACWGJB_37120 [Streptomyces sp. NPDC054813]